MHAAEALAAAPEISLVIPVVPAGLLSELSGLAPGLARVPKLGPAVAGGAERQDSVRAGLDALPTAVRLVAVHDAARPLVPQRGREPRGARRGGVRRGDPRRAGPDT